MKIALSVGCPCGIGPEVAAVAVSELGPGLGAKIALIGDPGAIADAAALRGVRLEAMPWVSIVPVSTLPPSQRLPGRPGVEAGRAQLAAVDRALDLVLAGEADAMVTGPVSKRAIASSGVAFVGHTEHLQARTRTGHVVMMFAGPRLRTSLVTTHLPIAEVPRAIEREAVARTIGLTARALWRDYAVEQPRVVVAGLNPHAGEGGMFGVEDRDVIAPAVDDARSMLAGIATVEGPMGAESAFRQARDGRFDAVVAMYHDQATIASKLLDFGHAVNVTLGLPVIRTSVDHGTGYDIAGRGTAGSDGMRSAVAMAVAIAERRRGRGRDGTARSG